RACERVSTATGAARFPGVASRLGDESTSFVSSLCRFFHTSAPNRVPKRPQETARICARLRQSCDELSTAVHGGRDQGRRGYERTETCTERSRGPSNSQKKMPWYVPSARSPRSSGISTCGPTREERTCDGPFGPSLSSWRQIHASSTIV